MKLVRRRKPSMKTMLGITKAKRSISKATGIPTTKSGRKRKVMNALTDGAYGKYERTRAAVNRPYKMAKNPPSCMGCLVWVMSPFVILLFMLAMFCSTAVAENTVFFNNPKLATFFDSYNAITESPISENELSKWHIDGKYSIYRDDVEWTIYAYDDDSPVPGVHITISAKAKNDLALFAYFEDILNVFRPELQSDDVKNIWKYAKAVAEKDILERLRLENDFGLIPTEIEQLSVSYFSLINKSTGLYTYHVKIHDESYLFVEK